MEDLGSKVDTNAHAAAGRRLCAMLQSRCPSTSQSWECGSVESPVAEWPVSCEEIREFHRTAVGEVSGAKEGRMTPITSWRPFRSFVRRDGLFDDRCREFVRLPEIGTDPAATDTEDAASDDEAT
jgi:hypothetical protein